MNLIGFDYINKENEKLTELFVNSSSIRKYVLGVNKLTKSIQKHIKIDGIIDDFTRVQSSRKKHILKIENIPKDSIILCVSLGSPLEVKNKLNKMKYIHFDYFSFFRYSKLDLLAPPFMLDFKNDFLMYKKEYEKIYFLLKDKKSKQIFVKILNFKMTFDLKFMEGFTNNQEEQYFEKKIIGNIKNIVFLDGGSYVGDTIPQIINTFPDYKKIYAIEPNELHINIAKRNFENKKNIEFIHCGLGKEIQIEIEKENNKHHGEHGYQARNINTIDNIVIDEVHYIKLDIEGAEQDAINGAKNTINKYHPILAICVYHKSEDWYKIPETIFNIRDDYDIYLRHYMEGIYETVMYFIPMKK